jgi:site-specific DNA recombinase
VSTAEQTRGFSLPTQLASCREYARAHGYLVVGEFTDDAPGATTTRPGLSRLYDALRESSASVVIALDVDRLGRGATTLAVIEHQIERLGGRVEFVRGQEYTGPEGELLKAIKAALSGYENALRTERVRRGMRGRVQAGFPLLTFGIAPYGYRYQGGRRWGRLEPDPVEAAVVRDVFTWYTTERLSTYAIAKRLTARGVPTRYDLTGRADKRAPRGAWVPTVIAGMLRNPVYKGEFVFGRTRRVRRGERVVQEAAPDQAVTCPVPGIVDEAMWQEAQRRRHENRHHATRESRHPYLLKGMVFCPPPCGRRWTARYRPERRRTYYTCNSRGEFWHPDLAPDAAPDAGITTHGYSLRGDVLDAAVWQAVCALLSDPDLLARELARGRAAAEEEGRRLAERLAAADRALADVDRKLATLLVKELEGYPPELLADHRRRLLSQRDDLRAERDRLAAQAQAAATWAERVHALVDPLAELRARHPALRRGLGAITAELLAQLPHINFAACRRLLDALQVRVTVLGPDRVRLRCVLTDQVLPLPPLPSASAGVATPTTTTTAGEDEASTQEAAWAQAWERITAAYLGDAASPDPGGGAGEGERTGAGAGAGEPGPGAGGMAAGGRDC